VSGFRWDGDNLLISLHVRPRARTAGIAGPHGDASKIRVNAAPDGNRANRVALLAKTFSVPRSAVSVKNEASGRRKRVRVMKAGKLPSLPGLAPGSASPAGRIKQ